MADRNIGGLLRDETTGALTVLGPGGTPIGGGGAGVDAIKGKTGWFYPGAGDHANFAPALNTPILTPIIFAEDTPIDRIGVRVATAGAAGAVARLGIYGADVDNLPSTLELDAGTTATTTTGEKLIVVAHTITAGLHFLCCVSQVATCTYQCHYIAPWANILPTTSINPRAMGLTAAAVAGALPNPIVVTGSNDAGSPPAVKVRIA